MGMSGGDQLPCMACSGNSLESVCQYAYQGVCQVCHGIHGYNYSRYEYQEYVFMGIPRIHEYGYVILPIDSSMAMHDTSSTRVLPWTRVLEYVLEYQP